MPAHFESGFVVREPAWHGLATVLDEYPGSWSEARRLAGLDWEPVEAPVYVGEPLTVPEEDPEDEDLEVTELPGWKAITRSDTGDVLAVKQDSYEVFPNAELGPLIEALLDEPDVQYETGGVLAGGRKVWIMVKLATPFEIPGDPLGATLSRLAIQNSHDGSGALRAQRLQTRIVCSNTSAAADREAGRHGLEYTFRHTANMRDRVEDAKIALAGLRSDRQNYQEWAAELIKIGITDPQREEFVQRFIPDPPSETLITDRVRFNIDQARNQFRDLYASPTMPEQIHGTAYGLVAASIEYLDHVRTYRNPETHFTRSMLKTEPLKRKAEKLALDVALS